MSIVRRPGFKREAKRYTPRPAVNAPVPTQVLVSPGSFTIVNSGTQQLTAQVVDQFTNTYIGPVTWQSSNPSVATVDANGLVTYVSPGSATITAFGPMNLCSGTSAATMSSGTQSAAITGTAASSFYETAMVSGGRTIVITLTGTTFVSAGATFDAQRQGIINGIVAATSPANGFNSLRSTIPVTACVRTSASVVTITLPALGSYSIASNESLSVTVPSAATVAGSPIVATPNITIIEGAAPAAAPRDLVFNSLEPGAGPVGTNPDYLCSDDFSRGAWYEVDADQSLGGTLTCGWYGNIYENPITPTNAVVGGGVGLHGRTYAASSGFMDGSPGGRNMASREFGGVNVTDVYWRIYFKGLPGYVGGHEKQFDFIRGRNHGGLVSLSYIRGTHVDYISYLHQDNSRPGGLDTWLTANMAPALTLINDHWYCIEMHVTLNTPGVYDGLYEMWMDDCGVDGRSQPSALTLRARYTDIMWRDATESAVDIGGIWIENWANPGSTGTEYYANLIVSRAPIGPAPFPENQ